MTSSSGSEVSLNAGVQGIDAAAHDDYEDGASVAEESNTLKYDSIAKAKEVLAHDRRARCEAERTYRIRENEISHQQALAAEQQAEEDLLVAEENMDEHASRLLEEMKTAVMKRYEADLYATLRKKVIRDFETNKKPGLKQTLKDNVYEELYTELKPAVEAELAAELYKTVEEELRAELTPVIEAELVEALGQSVKEQLEAELRPAIEAQIQDEIRTRENLKGIGFQVMQFDPEQVVAHSDTENDSEVEFIDSKPRQRDEDNLPEPRKEKPAIYPELPEVENGVQQQQYTENEGEDAKHVNQTLKPGNQPDGYVESSELEGSNAYSPDIKKEIDDSAKTSPKRSLEHDDDTAHSPSKRAKFEIESPKMQSNHGILNETVSTPVQDTDDQLFLPDTNASESEDVEGNGEYENVDFHAVNIKEEEADVEQQLEYNNEDEEVEPLDENHSDVENEDVGKRRYGMYAGPESEEEEGEEEEEEGEDDEDEDEDDEDDIEEVLKAKKAPASLITKSNTKETAIDLRDSDDEDDFGEDDADTTLVETVEHAKSPKIKAIYDGAGDEDEDDASYEDESFDGTYMGKLHEQHIGVYSEEMEVDA